MDQCSSLFKCNFCSYKYLYSLICTGSCSFIIFVIIRSQIVSLDDSDYEVLADNHWRRKTMEDFEVNRRRYIYVFNWTNINEYFGSNDIPEMSEIGPFIFKETRRLLNVQWGSGNVSYQRRSTWEFLHNESMSLDSNVTHINPILAITINRARNISNPLLHREFDYIIDKKDAFAVTKTVGELLLEDFVDKHWAPLKITPVEKFRWFDNSNLTSPNIYTLFANGELTINATTVLFQAFPEKLQFATIEESFCSNLTFYPSGLLVTNYLAYDIDDIKCGNANSFNNYYDPPISVSLPHFLDREKNTVKGLLPSQVHRSTIIYDQATKVRLETNITQQINIGIERVPWSETSLKNITSIEVPVLWYKESSRMPSSIWNDVQSKRSKDQNKIIVTTLAVLSFIFVAIIIGFVALKRIRFMGYFEPSLLSNQT